MGLIKHSELETTDSIQQSLNRNIDNNNRDILTTRTAISKDKFPEVYNGLLKYNTGSTIKVTYYRKYSSYLNKQSENYSFSLEQADIDLSYDLIYNFEIALESALDINYDNETGEFSIDGTAFIYPRTDPKIGDIFLYKILNDNIGVFIINNIDRLSISINSQYKISFNLYSFLNDDITNKLNNNIAHVYYFDKQKYIDNNVILLDSDTYITYNKLNKIQLHILDNYLNIFYNKNKNTLFNTYIKNNNNIIDYYDPFIIEFLYNSIEITKSKYSIKQLFGNLVDNNFFNTIYNGLINHDIYMINLYKYVIVKKNFNIYNANITSIVSDYFLYPIEDTDDFNKLSKDNNYYIYNDLNYYIFSQTFYNYLDQIKLDNIDLEVLKTDNNLDKIEKLILYYFIYYDIDSDKDFKNILISTMLSYREILSSKSNFIQFYYWSIIMFFLKIAIRII